MVAGQFFSTTKPMPKDESYYPDDSEPKEMDPEKDDGGSGMEEGGVQTALIPKSLLMGKEFNPGDEVVFEVVHLYEDEVEIKYATGEDKEHKKKEPGTMEASEDELDMMAKEPEGNPGKMMGGY